MNKYKELKNKQQKEFHNFPMFFAFLEEQMNEGLIKLNTTRDDIVSIGFSGYVRKSDLKAYKEMQKTHEQQMEKVLEDKEFLYQAFRYELANHEFCVNEEYNETLSSLGLKFETLTKEQKAIMQKAAEDYMSTVVGW